MAELCNVFGYTEIPFELTNGWFTGKCNLTGYLLEELLGTKLRALYQRRKGRDLFDLYWALKNGNVDTDKVIHCYKTYMGFSVNQPPTKKQFLVNMDEKMMDKEFLDDIHIILKQGIGYENGEAWEKVRVELIDKLV